MNANLQKADLKALNRSPIVRIGKKLRKYINPFIKRHSRIGDTAIFEPEHFPWISQLEDNWMDIRRETEDILAFRAAIPPLAEISPDHAKLDDKGHWRSYFMWGYGFKSPENCARCPNTTKLLETIPGLRTALFSIHAPGMCIAPHKGVTAGICVVHLGLIIPKERENCAIRVEDSIMHWQEGKAFAFDDTRQHETWNKTDEERVILLLHVDRPTRFPGSLMAKLFMFGIRWSPFIGDARKKMDSWNTAFKALETDKTNN